MGNSLLISIIIIKLVNLTSSLIPNIINYNHNYQFRLVREQLGKCAMTRDQSFDFLLN